MRGEWLRSIQQQEKSGKPHLLTQKCGGRPLRSRRKARQARKANVTFFICRYPANEKAALSKTVTRFWTISGSVPETWLAQ
jgi:hypothetical protein